jgi:hypothetical protein
MLMGAPACLGCVLGVVCVCVGCCVFFVCVLCVVGELAVTGCSEVLAR